MHETSKDYVWKKIEEYLNQDQPCTSWEQSLHPNEDWLKSEMFIIMTRILWKIEKVIYAVKLKKKKKTTKHLRIHEREPSSVGVGED